MDHALQTISYIADIGSTLVLMARRRLAQRPAAQPHSRRLYKMICHVFQSEDVSSGLWVSRGRWGAAWAPALHQSPTQPPCHPCVLPSPPCSGPQAKYPRPSCKTLRPAATSTSPPRPRPVSLPLP